MQSLPVILGTTFVITQMHLVFVFAGVLCLSIIMSLILWYHWYSYAPNRPLLSTMKVVYYTGTIVLLCVMCVSAMLF